MTGSRPNATQLSFPISDRVQAKVDVATGNLLVTTSEFSLVGVTSTINTGAAYNSRGWQTSANSLGNGWTYDLAGAGSLSTTSAGVVLTEPDGSTWVFVPGSTSGTYSSPAGLKSVLTSNSSGYTLTDLTSRQVTAFDTSGNPLSITDKNGNATTINYSGGIPSSIVTSAGPVAARTLTLGYDSTGDLDTQTNGYSTRSAHYQFVASSGNITSFTDPNGNTTSFGYSGTDLTSITSPTGAVTNFSYSGTTHMVAEVDQQNTTSGSPGTSTTRLTYPSTTQTLVAGPDTNTSVAVATGPHTTYSLNSAQELVNSATDAMGRVRSATYTANADVQTSTTGAGSAATTTTGTYAANNGQSLSSVQSQGGSTATATYGSTAATAYQVASVTDDAGDTTTNTFDGVGNQLSNTTGTGATAATATVTYNSNGTVATALAPGNGTNKTLYNYNTNNQLSTITPVTGSSLGTKTFTYDAFGRIASETDGAGRTTTYTYDNDDRALTASFSDGTNTVTDTYDKAGSVLTAVSASGTITDTYDQLERLVSTVNTAGGGTLSYSYDQASNQVSSTDTFGTYTNTFDASGVLLVTKYPKAGGYLFTDYRTDANGRRTDTWLQGNSTFTNAGSDPSSWAAHYQTAYDANGRVQELKAWTGPSTSSALVLDNTYCHNSASTSTCSTATSTDHNKLQWSKNLLSNQKTVYAYDGLGHIHTVTQSGGSSGNTTWTYTYDSRGNRLTSAASGSTTSSQTLTYNAANQITNTGYSYDGAGNLTASPTETYTYNAAEQMTTAKNTSTGVTTSYTYAGAAQNQVLSETTPGGTSYGIVYGLNGIDQYKAGNSSAHIYSDPVTSQALMLTTSSDIDCMYVYDGQGNPVGLITDFSTNSFSYSYDPYGTQVLTAGGTGNGASQNPYAFQGGIQDRASGLIKFGLRWYNPVTGTWTQQDTMDAPLDPANANRYAFAGDDPINNSDPAGQSAIETVVQLILAVLQGKSLADAYDGLTAAQALGLGFGTAAEAACNGAALLVGSLTDGLGLFGILFCLNFGNTIGTLYTSLYGG